MPEELHPINVVSASAGTGKTYHLASKYSRFVTSGVVGSPAEIIATTFTNMAAGELAHRIRAILLREWHWEQAQETFASLIGTVNSVCGRLVGSLVIEAGLSPSVTVLDEDRQKKVFDTAVEEITSEYATRLWATIYRTGLEEFWRTSVGELVTIARQNNIASDVLNSFADQSWTTFVALLPDVKVEDRTFYVTLKNELRRTIEQLQAADDGKQNTQKTLEDALEIQRTWQSIGEITWQAIAKLAKLAPSRKCDSIVQKLRDYADQHNRTQAFRDDAKNIIYALFSCAADCMRMYQEYKAARGMLDFVDQESLALSFLQQPYAKALLQERYRVLFVDEFQDTSPIQLAVFLELARMVNQSIWVGDQKQAIYGFRGADPLLVQSVIAELMPTSGGQSASLAKSYRSRPSLVNFVNSVFVPALTQFGMDPRSIEITECSRVESSEMNSPLHLWWLEGGSQKDAAQSLARGIFDMLSEPDKWIVDSNNGRRIKGSDIAVLCRTNDRRVEVADALAALGILVSTERSGLLNTPECVLSLAVLRYLVDRYDALAIAEVVRYTDLSDDRQQWLYDWFLHRAENVAKLFPVIAELDELRVQLLGLTPVEATQIATTSPAVIRTILSWSNQRQRLLNLEALVGLANEYEVWCSTERQAASVAGLITYLVASCKDATQPANPDENAVRVLTYHSAKGLEWPFVIMYELSSPREITPFEVRESVNMQAFNCNYPLSGKSIYYWPWPYGRQKKDLDLGIRAQQSPSMKEAISKSRAEHLRLLYVGMTRARDYLVLACRKSKGGTDWLEMACDTDGKPIFLLQPDRHGLVNILSTNTEVKVNCIEVRGHSDSVQTKLSSCNERYHPIIEQSIEFSKLPYSCVPSGLKLSSSSEANIELVKQVNLGQPLELMCPNDMRIVGDALHAFLAIDEYRSSNRERIMQASRISNANGVTALLPEQFVEVSTRLKEALDELYPEADWLREWPVTGKYGSQRIAGSIDLLLSCTEGYVVIDHKSFPGKEWRERVISHYPQLDAYSQIVRQASGKRVVAAYIHLPLLGLLVSAKSTGNWESKQEKYESDERWLVV